MFEGMIEGINRRINKDWIDWQSMIDCELEVIGGKWGYLDKFEFVVESGSDWFDFFFSRKMSLFLADGLYSSS